MKLTKTKIDKLTYGKEGNKPHIVFDDEVPGFAIRIYPSGSKSFLIDYRVNGRQRRMVLGRYGVLTLDQARKIDYRHQRPLFANRTYHEKRITPLS